MQMTSQFDTTSNQNPVRPGCFICFECNKSYSLQTSLNCHLKYECGKPPRFQCPYCESRMKVPANVWRHVKSCHPKRKIYCFDVITNAVVTPGKKQVV